MTRDPDCIFCDIVAGKIPGEIIWQDEKHMALLDLFPLRKAQVVVIPRDHFHSSIFALPDDVYNGLMAASKKVAMLMEKNLKCERTMVVGEGMEIDHAHIKLYPRFDGENGLVHGGPQADFNDLAELGRIIRGD